MTPSRLARVVPLAAAAAFAALSATGVGPQAEQTVVPSHPVAAHPAFATTRLLRPLRQRARRVHGGEKPRPQKRAPVRAHAPNASRGNVQPPQQVVTTPLPATPDFVTPNDPAYPQEWALAQVHLPQAWQLVKGGHPVVVAVIDSGVDPSQPDLQGALVPGHNFVDGNDDTSDGYGHGTMVAGVIAARGNNGIGVTGACWSCLIMPIKVLDGNGAGTSTAIADGIRWAADHGALIVNMSLALTGDDPAVASAVAYAHDHGVLVISAAGNGSGTEVTFPAAYANVVSVAATDTVDHAYSWTTYGPWVTLASPGCSVTTARGGSYAEFCGTSAAAPLVAGLAGLALATGVPTAADVEAALQSSAQALPGVVGRGRVDALGLLQRLAH